jgi:hypothetical protein
MLQQNKTDVKDRFYEEPEHVFNKFPKYNENFVKEISVTVSNQ